MDKKLIKNYIYNILYQLVKILLSLVLIPYAYAHITPPVLGIGDYVGTIIGWFVLFGILGVNTYGNREIAKVRDHKEDLNRSFFEIFYMQVTNMLIASLAYYIFVMYGVKQHQDIYILSGVILLSNMLDISWFYFGVEDFKRVSLRNIGVKMMAVGLIFTFCKTPADLWKYILITWGSEIAGQLFMFAGLRKYISFEKVSLKDAYRHHFVATFELFIPTIAYSVYTLLDQTMIGYLYNPTHLEYYKTSQGFINMFLYFITAIGAVMLPRITNVYHKDENGSAKAEELINITMKISLMLAFPMCFGMMAISKSFIGWYLIKHPAAIKIVSDLIMMGCPIILFISMSSVTGAQYLVPVGMYNQYSTSIVVGAIVNFVCNCFLIPRYGAYGAIIGSIVAEFTVALVQMHFTRKKVHIAFEDRSYRIYLFSSLLMMGIVMLVSHFLPFGKMNTLISVLVGVIVYAACLYFSHELIFEKAIQMIRKKKEKEA